MNTANKDNNDYSELIRMVRKADVSTPPFMETVILAKHKERVEKRRLLKKWKWIAASFGSVALFIALIFSPSMTETFYATPGQAVLVKVDVLPKERVRIVRAEVELPEDVIIFATNHPEIHGKHSLHVDWMNAGRDSAFPFVISSSQAGLKKIKVRFFDQNNNLAQEKIVKIKFLGRS